MQQSNRKSGMKNQRTFKKLYLKKDAVEFLARQNKETKRTRKQARQNKKVITSIPVSC
jgi:hypothetical protein